MAGMGLLEYLMQKQAEENGGSGLLGGNAARMGAPPAAFVPPRTFLGGPMPTQSVSNPGPSISPRDYQAAEAGDVGRSLERKPYPSENEYFRANPHVAGMAAEDNKVILNPYSKLSPQEMAAVYQNESARIAMRTGRAPRPAFELTPEQVRALKGTPYENNPDAARETIAARLLSGDPSGGAATNEQRQYIELLRKAMGK